jgi:hypothetical protein
MSGRRLIGSAAILLALIGSAAFATGGIAVARGGKDYAKRTGSYRAADASGTVQPGSAGKSGVTACPGPDFVIVDGHTARVTPAGPSTGGAAGDLKSASAPAGTASVSVDGQTVREIAIPGASSTAGPADGVAAPCAASPAGQ